MLARAFHASSKAEEAKAAAGRGCRALLACTAEADWRESIHTYRVCKLAKNYGLQDEELHPTSITSSGTRRAPIKRIEAQRTSGRIAIQPPKSARDRMIQKHVRQTTGEFQLCISKSGLVSGINVIISTGFPSYDRRIFEEMRKWVYRPFNFNGKPTSMCTTITFVYIEPPSRR